MRDPSNEGGQELTWSEFEAKHPKDLYEKFRQLCEEKHDEGLRKGGFSARFCNYCYEREGWRCFPCSDIAKQYEKRYGEPLNKTSTSY